MLADQRAPKQQLFPIRSQQRGSFGARLLNSDAYVHALAGIRRCNNIFAISGAKMEAAASCIMRPLLLGGGGLIKSTATFKARPLFISAAAPQSTLLIRNLIKLWSLAAAHPA